ncbi:hypothetical protein DAEQUDRAFT_345904 [Daedalea quercina L-15889]|uniref:Uncharacterized protein n=1 Tax=Daedalea quercina L-15889 TaxID=1314783 RepID=A0A165PBV1_9APHY|nr:hypothetical protein DAEQUDRAFT_345904 [Daedalea quercina L-15889]
MVLPSGSTLRVAGTVVVHLLVLPFLSCSLIIGSWSMCRTKIFGRPVLFYRGAAGVIRVTNIASDIKLPTTWRHLQRDWNCQTRA